MQFFKNKHYFGGRFVWKIVVGLMWTLLVYIMYHLSLTHSHLSVDKLLNQNVLEPLVDKSQPLSEGDITADIQIRYPNLPIAFWKMKKNKAMRLNDTCARFPSLFEIEFSNIYWQTLTTSNGTFQLYGAYLDIRKNNKLAAVRILGMINRFDPEVPTYCQFWFKNQTKPVITKSSEYRYIWDKKWNRKWEKLERASYKPYLISCLLPKDYKNKIPQSVSLVENQCDNSTNSLRVIYNKVDDKKDFAVCVKGLDYLQQDLSVRLVEWIELIKLLGADKIFFYELQVHPNISKVLRYYQDRGDIDVTPTSLAGGQPNLPGLQHYFLSNVKIRKRQDELIPYNDCFYKHMYEYRFIALLDIDEVIMPFGGNSWKELMDKVVPEALNSSKEQVASYNVRNIYFLDDLMHDHEWFKEIPKYMHMLQHVYRSANFTKPKEYVKCFHDTEKVLTLHNHFPLSCIGSDCFSYPIETTDAQLQHYRADCVTELKKTCDKFRETRVMDATIWKFKEPLIDRVSNTLHTLGFLH